MDLICSLGMHDISAFTLAEITQLPGAGPKWMQALAYFRTGKKNALGSS